ncbi:zinc ribbon domain-containing protein [Clostridium estertheticum]|uniref:zinc ribbon domain-containing protein n=1 Tax=Clostridium estertheticum TaxID=238834 RepID=UPI0035C7FA30
MWEAAQLEIIRKRTFAEKYNISKLDYATMDNPLAGRVICGHCGSSFGRKGWNSTDERLKSVILFGKMYSLWTLCSCLSKRSYTM